MMQTAYTINMDMSDQAIAQYQAWADNVLTYKGLWSRSGTKMQRKPIRNAMLWRIPNLPPTGSKMQMLPLRNAREWPVFPRDMLTYGLGYKGPNVGAVQPVSLGAPAALGIESIALGVLIGWFIGKRLIK